MSNNIAVSITADVADLRTKLALAQADVRSTTRSLNDLARQAQTSGMTDALKTQMLAAGDAAAKAERQVTGLRRQLGGATSVAGLTAVTAGAKDATTAMEGLHAGTAGVTREMIVLGREASRGNFSRMAGSVTILAQRMGLLTPAVLGTGAAILAVVAPMIALLVAAERGSEEMAKFRNAMEATNGYAGVSISQLQQMAAAMSSWANEGVGAATKELMGLAASGRFTGAMLQLVGADATRMSQLTGESADKWNAEFEKMSDGVAKFAAEYQARYGQLTTAQFAYIQQLEQQGQKESAEYALAKDVYDYLGNQAPQNLGTLETAWRSLTSAMSDYWDGLKSVGRNSSADQIRLAQDQISFYTRQKANSPAGSQTYDAPLAAARQQLALALANKYAEDQRAGATAAATQQQKDGVAAAQKLHEQFEASRTSGEKLKATLAEIDSNLAKAVAADPGNRALYEREAVADRAQAVKSDTPKASGKESQSTEWTTELQQAEYKARSDAGAWLEDMTGVEVKFWEAKVAAAKQGSKAYGEAQQRLQAAQLAQQKQLAEQQLAADREQVEATKGNYAEHLAALKAYLADAKRLSGDQGTPTTEAKGAEVSAARAHQEELNRIAADGAREQLAELQSNMDAAKAIRDQDARTQEATIQSNAKSSPILGEVQAASQIAALHKQANAQELADEQTLQAAKTAILDDEIAAARTAYGRDSTEYKKAVDAKTLADLEWANKQRVLLNQMVNQQVADNQKIAQAWHSTIDPLVATTGNQIKSLVAGTETWQQAIMNIGEQALNIVIQQIEKLVAAWIVNMVTGQGSQMANAAKQVSSYSAIAGAAGVASMAGAPFPISLGAPAFGAGMAAVAMGFGSIGGFAAGANIIPEDMIAQIHAGERVIPAADNRQLMQAVTGGGRGGKTHNHVTYAPQLTTPSGKSWKQELQGHESDVISLIQTAFRNGKIR